MRSAVKGLSRCSSQDVDEFDYADDGRNDGNLNTIMSIFGPEIGIKKLTKKTENLLFDRCEDQSEQRSWLLSSFVALLRFLRVVFLKVWNLRWSCKAWKLSFPRGGSPSREWGYSVSRRSLSRIRHECIHIFPGPTWRKGLFSCSAAAGADRRGRWRDIPCRIARSDAQWRSCGFAASKRHQRLLLLRQWFFSSAYRRHIARTFCPTSFCLTSMKRCCNIRSKRGRGRSHRWNQGRLTLEVCFTCSSSFCFLIMLTLASSNCAKPMKMIVGKQTKSNWKAQNRMCEIGENRLKQTFWQPGWFVSHLKLPWKAQFYRFFHYFCSTYAFISVDRSANDGDNKWPEGEEEKQPSVTQRGTIVEGFGDDAFNRRPNHLETFWFVFAVLLSVVVFFICGTVFEKERAAHTIYSRAKRGGTWRATRRRTLTDEDLTEPDKKRIIIR